jgi:hypothetical protein
MEPDGLAMLLFENLIWSLLTNLFALCFLGFRDRRVGEGA